MKYRYEISQEDIANFRNTTLDEELDVLDPDGFVAEEEIGDAIMEEYGWDMTKEKVMKQVMKTETQKLNVTAAGWESVAASYEPDTDTVLVEAKATNGDTTMVRWTRDGSGDICDDRYTEWKTFDKLTDALFAAVWDAAPGPESES